MTTITPIAQILAQKNILSEELYHLDNEIRFWDTEYDPDMEVRTKTLGYKSAVYMSLVNRRKYVVTELNNLTQLSNSNNTYNNILGYFSDID